MTGQTYSRKVDVDCLSTLASLGATVHKVNPLEAACFPTRLLPPSGEGWNCSTVDTTPSADPFVSLLPSTRSALISAYWPTWRSWKSLLRKSRSVNSTSSHYNALSYIHKQAFKQVFPPCRFQCHALQEEPNACGAVLQFGPPSGGTYGWPTADGLSPVAGEDAGRQRQQVGHTIRSTHLIPSLCGGSRIQ